MPIDKVELIRDGIAEFERTGRAGPQFADDFVWDFSGLEGWIEDTEYHGRQGFDEQMRRWTEPFESWSMELTDLVDAGGDDVLVLGVQRGILKGSTQPVEMPLSQIFTIRDGKLARIRLFAQHEHAYAAAGVDPPAPRVSRDKFEVLSAFGAEFTRTGRVSDDLADDFIWDFSGFEGWVEDEEYRGREAFAQQMARWTEPFESWTMELEKVIDAGGDDILALGIQRGVLAGSAAVIEMPIAHIWTIRDEKLTRMRIFAQHEHAYAAAGVDPPAQASA